MDRLNSFARCDIKPQIKPAEMVLNDWYKVEAMRKIKTTFGETILVELSSTVLFLPKRLTSHLTKSVIDDLLSGTGCYIRYIGQKQINPGCSPANQFEFTKGDQ